MKLEEAILRVSGKTGIPKEVVKAAYKSQWEFIRQHIEELPLKEDLSKEEFDRLRTNFNVPSLGKMSCTYDRYIAVKKEFEVIKKLRNNVQDKKD
jgi:hypothetical protein